MQFTVMSLMLSAIMNNQMYSILDTLMRFIISITLIFLNACTVLQPVHEAQPPETLGPWGFRLAALVGNSPTIATDVSGNVDTNSYSMPLEGFRIGIGLGDNFEIDDDSFLGGSLSAGNSLALKWQILGKSLFESKAGDTALTLCLRNSTGGANGFTSTPISQSSHYSTDLNLNSYDASIVLGKRVTNIFGAYAGLKDISGSVSANYRDSQNGPIVLSQSKNFNAYGALAGIYISANGSNLGFDLTLEAEYMNLPSTYSNNTTWASNITTMLGFPFRF
jgi:hypothetical protein